MTNNDKPDVIDLSKNSDDDSTDGPDSPTDHQDYPDDVDDRPLGETDGPDELADEIRDDYPEGVEDNTEVGETDGPDDAAEAYNEEYPQELEGDFPGAVDGDDTDGVQGDADDNSTSKSGGEDEKALNLGEYELQEKVEDSGFQEVSEGDMVLIQTPLEGAKVGEVNETDKSWTGTLQMKVDCGVNEYTITPYDDEYSEKFCGVVSENQDVTSDLLGSLGKASPDAVEQGDDVVIDVPTCGAVKGMVAHKTQTETQGHKIDVKCGPVYFKIYEDPTAQQRKEQPYLVGKVTQ